MTPAYPIQSLRELMEIRLRGGIPDTGFRVRSKISKKTVKKFEDLQAWQTARALVNAIYAITKGESLVRNYGLKDQIQRAAVSAMSNIAEGFARLNRREKIQLYNVARASAAEVRSLLYILGDQKLSDKEELSQCFELVDRLGAMITGLIRSFSAEVE